MTKERKQEIIEKFAQSKNDTGSAQVQIALLTERINELTEHLKVNPKDNHSRRGLLKLVGKRKGFLSYLEKTDLDAFRALKKELNLGKEKIGRLLLAFSVPCIISMLINSIYNIVDQIFIGQGVGYLGNAATNVIFPIVIFCNAVAGLIGNGCAANLSLRLG